MPRGNYDIQPSMDVEASKQAGRDSSYRSCVHAMLIFLIVCIILLLATWPWKSGNNGNSANNSSSPDALANKGGKFTTSTTTEGPRTIPYKPKVTPTTARTSTARTRKSTTTTESTITTTEYQIQRKAMTDIVVVTEIESEEATTPLPSLLPPDVVTEPKPTEEPEDTSDEPVESHAEDGRELPNEGSEEQTTEQTTQTTLTTLSDEFTTIEETTISKDIAEGSGDSQPIKDDVTSTEATIQVTTEVPDAAVSEGGAAVESLTPADDEMTSPAVTPVQEETTTESLSSKASKSEKLIQLPTQSVTPSSQRPDHICETSHCKVLASRMLSLMNHSVDACDDFYEFSCGGLRSSPGIVADNPEKYAFDRIEEKLKDISPASSGAHLKFQRYYKSCVAYDKEATLDERMDEARKLLDTVGVFNDIENTNPQLEDLTTLLGNMLLLHSTPILDITLDVDVRNESRFALKLTPPSFKNPFGLSSRYDHCHVSTAKTTDLNDYYFKYTDCKQRAVSKYVDELEVALKALGITQSPASIHDVRADAELELFGTWMENLPQPGALRQGLIGKDFTEMTIKQLRKQFSIVDWESLISRLLNKTVTESTLVQVYFKSYFDQLFMEMGYTKARNRQNVLLAWLIHDLYEDFVLTRSTCTRDTYCLHVASELMEDVSSSLYLSSFPQAELDAMSEEAQQLFSELRRAMEPQLRDAAWLNDQSRSAVVSKLNSLTLAVDGGRSLFMNESTLNLRMRDLVTDDDGHYFTMSIGLLRRYRRLMYSLYDVNPNSIEAIWTQFGLPYYSTGVAIYALKKIVIPYGLMTWPIYEPSLPRHILMARLGFVIAHEMAHHFDNNGVKHGDLLSDDSEVAFSDMTNCHKDVASFNSEVEVDDGRLIKFDVSEKLTLNERLADRTAAALSLEAYNLWVGENYEPQELPYLGMSNEKTYFLAVAQMFCSKTTILDYGISLFENEHPPPFLRVNTVLDNTPEFASAYGCAVGVAMNPINNCDVFPKLAPVTLTQSTIFS